MKLHSFILITYGYFGYGPYLCTKADNLFGIEGRKLIQSLLAERYPEVGLEDADPYDFPSIESLVEDEIRAGKTGLLVATARNDFVNWVLSKENIDTPLVQTDEERWDGPNSVDTVIDKFIEQYKR